MKIIINEVEDIEDVEIVINCKTIDENVTRIISKLKALEEKITGNKDGKIFILDTNEIFYFESVDKKTFIYMDREVFQTHLRLYELEERLKNTDFFRASKSTIINLRKVKNIVPMFGGRIEILLDNDEKLVVSRQYVPILKNKLDL
ncbi:histidine kinase [Clostridium sulfidigenes]|uniref:Histidine kinase n=1 Tax=Clostridium sulfidigenes TaxID=318464 RepID=A0A084J7V1_9CLOT|nr:LytTR family DNA-binding domain-containing protein [Clostridium sulfidigenes]KEZ85035.1 histidine kinase [Clostridium sulfidigenes]